MIVGFTGTQQGMTEPQLAAFADLLARLRPETLRHGDCVGADAQAHRVALNMGIKIIIHPPIYWHKRAFCEGASELLPARDYLVRNHLIVQLSDCMIATPSGPEVLRSGTWATIRYARKMKRPLCIILPSGLARESKTFKDH